MLTPPGGWQRQESSHEVLDRSQGQNGGCPARAREEIRAGNGDVPVLPRGKFHLALPHVARQASNASKLEILAK
jgi:hypothetical protein